MINLNLTLEEQQTLVEMLECSIRDIHSEIVHTDHREFREMLKNRKQMLLAMLDNMRQAESSMQGI